MSRSPRDDWKHTTAPRPGRPGTAAAPRRRSRLVVAVIPLLIAVGIALAMIFFWQSRPEPLFLSIGFSEYDRWPVNDYAAEDGKVLETRFGGRVPVHSQEDDAIIREMDTLANRPSRDRDRAVVIHICALAAVESDEVSILPVKAVPGAPNTWLRLSSVLAAMGKISGQRLLLLDLRPVADPRLGQDGTELAKALHEQMTKAERADTLPYVVFVQCAPAEYPFVSPELRRGMFAEFLRRGLSGHADGWNDGKSRDLEVSVQELLAYTRGRLADWLGRHQAPALLPVAYGKAADFTVRTYSERELNEPQPELGAPPTGKIGEAWAKVDAWRKNGTHRTSPRTFRQLETTVARADRLVAGGANLEEVERVYGSRIVRVEAQLKALRIGDYPVPSVGRARRAGIEKEKEIAPKLLPVLDGLRQPGGKPEEAKGKLSAFWKEPPEQSPYDATVSAVLESIVKGDDLNADQLKVYLDLLRGLTPPAGQLEISVLAFFTDPNVTTYRKLWPGRAARAAVRAAIAGEQAAVADGRALKRIERSLAEVDREFRQALATLFLENQAKWDEATDQMSGLPARYLDIGRLGQAQERALFEWDETIALLPTVVDFTPTSPVARDSLDEAWKDMVLKARQLRSTIDAPAANTADLEGRAAEMQNQRKTLLGMLKGDPASEGAVELRARLRLPIWTAAERQQWTARADALAQELATSALGGLAAAPVDVRAPVTDTARSDELATRRVRRAMDLLSLAGEPPPKANDLRDALADKLVARYRKETDPSARERFAWVIHPDDWPAVPETAEGARQEPAAEARRNAQRAMARWLIDNRLQPLIDAMNAQPAKAARALADDLNDAVQKLNDWRP